MRGLLIGLLLVLALVGLLVPGAGWGAVAVTDTSTSGAVGASSSVTFTHIVASGDVAVYVGVGWLDTGAASVSTITWNGSENFTQVCSGKQVDNGSAGWMIVNPTVGTFSIVVTWPEAVTAGVAGAMSLTGVVSTSVANAHRTAYANTGTTQNGLTVTVVDSVSGDLVVDSADTISATMGTIGAGQTSQAQDDAIGGGSTSWGMSTETATGANTVMSWTTPSSANNWTTCATALIPESAGGTATRAFMLLEVDP